MRNFNLRKTKEFSKFIINVNYQLDNSFFNESFHEKCKRDKFNKYARTSFLYRYSLINF